MAQHTKDFLSDELRKAGLNEMADKAATGYYHDYLSPLPLPEIQLDIDLLDAVVTGNKQAQELRMRHHNGEFDANMQESDDWIDSPEGQEVIGKSCSSKIEKVVIK